MADTYGFLKVDICNAKTGKELDELVKNSVDYWTKVKGYKLISDRKGNPDELTIYDSSSVASGEYVAGPGKTINAQTVLIYELVIEA